MMARLLLIASDRILLKEGDEMALADKVAEVVQQRRMEMY